MQFMIMNTSPNGSGKNDAGGAGFVEFTVSRLASLADN